VRSEAQKLCLYGAAAWRLRQTRSNSSCAGPAVALLVRGVSPAFELARQGQLPSLLVGGFAVEIAPGCSVTAAFTTREPAGPPLPSAQPSTLLARAPR
jgi:hypothetical protein